MKKILLSLAIAGVSCSVAAENYNGRLTAMSGAGYATGGYADGVLLNPALGASGKKDDDFALVINAGALTTDKDDLIDKSEQLTDYFDQFDTNAPLTPQTIAEIQGLLNAVDDRTAAVQAGGSIALAIPTEWVALTLFSKSRARLSATTLVADEDYAMLNGRIGETFDPEDPIAGLRSSIIGRGAIVTETGVAFAKGFAAGKDQQWLVGLTPKRITVESIVYSATVANFEEDELDADEYTRKSSATGLDAGVTFISGKIRYSFVARDLLEHRFATVQPGEEVEIKRQLTVATGYVGERTRAELALDVNAVPSLSIVGESQFLRAGLEYSLLSWLQLRAGLQQDLKNTMADTYSLGLGISPYDVVNIDLTGIKGSDNTVGAALQVGVRF